MIKPEMLQITIVSKGVAHYRSKGYACAIGDKILVKSTDLSPTSGIKVTRICEECGDVKQVKFINAKKICHSCMNALSRANAKYPQFTACLDCGSRCQRNAKKHKSEPVRCKSCHTKFMVGANNPNYGNGKKLAGANNPNYGKRGAECSWYKTEKTMADRLDKRQSSECVAWRRDVYRAANYHCDVCNKGLTGASIVAHHLESWNSNKDLRNEISNGVCLCKPCHTAFHVAYGFGNNTTQQYLEFKEANHG